MIPYCAIFHSVQAPVGTATIEMFPSTGYARENSQVQVKVSNMTGTNVTAVIQLTVGDKSEVSWKTITVRGKSEKSHSHSQSFTAWGGHKFEIKGSPLLSITIKNY